MAAQDTGVRKVSSLEVAAFAAPAAPLLALTLPTIIFLPPHYASYLGLPLGAVSAIFLAARVFDIIIDPLFGSLQDRTVSRFGRRRLWLALSCPFVMALVYWSFLGFKPGIDAKSVLGVVMALYFAYAAMFVAHLGWAGELIPTYHGRTRVLGAVQGASMLGQVLMLALAAIAVQALGGSDADAVAMMGWSMIVLLPLTTAIAVFGAREEQHPPQTHMSIAMAFKTLAQNKLVRRVLLPDLMLGVAQGISGGLFLFYFQHVLGFVREAQTLLFIYFVSGLAGVPIWILLGRALGKHHALQLNFTYTVLTTAGLLFLPSHNFSLAAVFMIVAGLGQGGGVLLTRSLMADVVDDDELNTGARRSGLYFGLLLTTSKLGLAAGPLTYAVLEVAGFDPRAGAANTDLALGALRVLFIGGPILLCIGAALSLRNYPLDEKRQAELAAAIAARKAAASVTPPA
jgi:glycoside/pentoside/hexuronide:cation symporter, GPH family